MIIFICCEESSVSLQTNFLKSIFEDITKYEKLVKVVKSLHFEISFGFCSAEVFCYSATLISPLCNIN